MRAQLPAAYRLFEKEVNSRPERRSSEPCAVFTQKMKLSLCTSHTSHLNLRSIVMEVVEQWWCWWWGTFPTAMVPMKD